MSSNPYKTGSTLHTLSMKIPPNMLIISVGVPGGLTYEAIEAVTNTV